jgi:hypothetical protein
MQSRRRHRPFRSILLWLGLLSAALFSPAAAVAAVQPGVVSDISWGISDTQKQREAAAMADAGVRWSRLSLNWHDLEPTKGTYSSYYLGDLDRAVQLTHDAGSKIILDLNQSPGWASGSTNKEAPPLDPKDVVPFLEFIANRYQGEVQAYEIWNEENKTRFWPSGPDPAAYAGLLRAAYPAVKAADPSALVLFGGLNKNDYHFVQAAYAAGVKGYFDVMAVHPYTCNTPTHFYWVAGDTESWIGEGDSAPPPGYDARISMYPFLGYREVHRSMLAAGDDKPIWFTEFGWSTSAPSTGCVYDEATQAQYLTAALNLASQDSYVQVALWYRLREDYWHDPSTDWDSGFGLMHQDFTPKPAYYAFRDYATGASSGSAPGTSAGTDPAGGATTAGGETTSTSTTPAETKATPRKRKKGRGGVRARRANAKRAA